MTEGWRIEEDPTTTGEWMIGVGMKHLEIATITSRGIGAETITADKVTLT